MMHWNWKLKWKRPVRFLPTVALAVSLVLIAQPAGSVVQHDSMAFAPAGCRCSEGVKTGRSKVCRPSPGRLCCPAAHRHFCSSGSSLVFLETRRQGPSWRQEQQPALYARKDPLTDEGEDSADTFQEPMALLSTSAVGNNLMNPKRSILFSLFMMLAGAMLGPFLDSYHSAFGVLQYQQPITAVLWGTDAQHPALITAWWVPELFGLAGFIIGWLYILLDRILLSTGSNINNNDKNNPTTPSLPKIFLGIAIFTFQYWLSGLLYSYNVDRTIIFFVMSLVAATGFVTLDATASGLITSIATALGGPLIEIGLLTASRQQMFLLQDTGYLYTDAGETGFFPLWIVPVYFLGGPAVGNLARGVWNQLSTSTLSISDNVDANDTSTTTTPAAATTPCGCPICNDTRCVPCPNCDGIGTYSAMGGRTVSCTSCRGRGFVMCRACFAHYQQDPYDLEAIRETLSRMPD